MDAHKSVSTQAMPRLTFDMLMASNSTATLSDYYQYLTYYFWEEVS